MQTESFAFAVRYRSMRLNIFMALLLGSLVVALIVFTIFALAKYGQNRLAKPLATATRPIVS